MKNQLKTFLLLGALGAIVVSLGAWVAPGLLPLFVVLALVMNVGAYYFSDRIVLRLHKAREVSAEEEPELHAMVAELAARAEIPKPRVCVLPESQPNAFATGRDPAHGVVAVTAGIRSLLTPRELRGVLAHEIAHIKNRDILVASVAACLAAVVSYVGNALAFGALFGRSVEEGQGGGGNLLVALLAPLGATLVQLGISRSREYMADETGARLSGDPGALADALLKLHGAARSLPGENPRPATASLFIVNPLTGKGLGSLFSTHPAAAERVRRLRVLALAGEHVPLESRSTRHVPEISPS